MEEYTNYLVHHGVKGMHWGIRRYQNADGSLTSVGRAKLGYKEAKKQYKQDAKNQRRASLTAVGATRLNRFQEARNKADSSRLKMIDAKAKYKKAKNGDGADIKVYSNQMRKTGLPGSASDDMYRGESARLYKHLTKTKGKAYADTVVKKTQNKVIRDLAISGTIAVGATATQVILTKKGYM